MQKLENLLAEAKMNRISAMIAALMVAASTGAAFAQDGRYSFERSGDDLLRLDSQTGAVSVCVMRDGQPVCQMGADDRMAYEDRIDALEDRIAALEKQVGSGAGAMNPNGLPSDDELEQTLGFMEKFMRRFFDIAKDLRDEFGSDPATPAPDRT